MGKDKTTHKYSEQNQAAASGEGQGLREISRSSGGGNDNSRKESSRKLEKKKKHNKEKEEQPRGEDIVEFPLKVDKKKKRESKRKTGTILNSQSNKDPDVTEKRRSIKPQEGQLARDHHATSCNRISTKCNNHHFQHSSPCKRDQDCKGSLGASTVPSFAERILLAKAHLRKVGDGITWHASEELSLNVRPPELNKRANSTSVILVANASKPTRKMSLETIWKPQPPLERSKVSEEDLKIIYSQNSQKVEPKSSTVIVTRNQTKASCGIGISLQERIQKAKSQLKGVSFQEGEEEIKPKPPPPPPPFPKINLRSTSCLKGSRNKSRTTDLTEKYRLSTKECDSDDRIVKNTEVSKVQHIVQLFDSNSGRLLRDKRIRKNIDLEDKVSRIQIEVDWTESKLWKPQRNQSTHVLLKPKYSNSEIDQSSLVRASLIKSIVASRASVKGEAIYTKRVAEVRPIQKEKGSKRVSIPKEGISNLAQEDNGASGSMHSYPKPHWLISVENVSEVQPLVRDKWDRVNGQLRSKLQAVERLP